MLKLPPSASNSNIEMVDEQMMYDFAYSRNEDISVHFIIRFSQVFYHFYSEKLFFLAKTFKFFAPAAMIFFKI